MAAQLKPKSMNPHYIERTECYKCGIPDLIITQKRDIQMGYNGEKYCPICCLTMTYDVYVGEFTKNGGNHHIAKPRTYE